MSKLDYCNSVLYNASQYQLDKLRRLQNTAARIVFKKSKYNHATPLLRELHWLPINKRVIFKVATTVYKCLNGSGPDYLQEMLIPYVPGRALRSSELSLMVVPKLSRNNNSGKKAFSFYGPSVWNSLPLSLRTCDSYKRFKQNLKTHLF